MSRVLTGILALAAFPLGARADEPAVRLSVRPMAAAKPALRYQLLPEQGELKPGNAAQNYLKCFMEQRKFFYGKDAVLERARYQTMPLAELPVDKLRDYGGFTLRQADWAARLDTIDWQTPPGIPNGSPGQLPPEVGPLQVLATALQVRCRAEVAGRHFDEALRTAKTMFALARHLGEHPTEVANLVGLWVAHLGLDTLEEMVQQPGCPNLYWALTDLPCPLLDVRKGVQGERALVAADLRMLRDDAPMSDVELEKFISHVAGWINFERAQAGESLRKPRPGLQARANDADGVRRARRRLVEAGCAEALVQRFPPLQVVLLDDRRAYEVERDERMKLLALPLWQIDSMAGSEERAGEGLFADLVRHVIKLRRAQGQLEQQIALLRHVEALRLYAADHDGHLPATPSAFSVPLPLDPVSGQPFAYTALGPTAHVRAENKIHYEITLRK
jgi:hypothetical protein